MSYHEFIRMLYADTILYHGHLFTNTRTRATALAMIGERIAAIGEDDEILALRGPRTRVINLHGRLATPGFTDAHVHLNNYALRLMSVQLQTARTLVEALRRVAARVKVTSPGEWIEGGGFDKNFWGDDFPTRRHLDTVAPHHPVALRARDGHAVWMNSLALRRCGITRHTTCGDGGVIRRDAKGDPTGILQETALALLYRCPAYTGGVVGPNELRQALQRIRRYGITSVHVMEEATVLPTLQALREHDHLPARITVYPYYAELDALIAARLRSGFGDHWLRLGGIKMMLDGTLGSQTAWLYAPHEHSDAGGGFPLLPVDEFHQMLSRAAAHGFACAVHAIGDRANTEALDAFEKIRHLPTPLPHRIEHAQLLRPEDMPRFAELGVIASMQPIHIPGDAATADRYWGARSRYAYAFRSLLRAGATLVFSSDAPIETPDIIAGLAAAVYRRARETEKPWYPEERLTLSHTLRAYTLGPALATGEGAVTGKLAPGYLADVAVFSKNLFTLRQDDFLTARVSSVWLAGKPVYQRKGVV